MQLYFQFFSYTLNKIPSTVKIQYYCTIDMLAKYC